MGGGRTSTPGQPLSRKLDSPDGTGDEFMTSPLDVKWKMSFITPGLNRGDQRT